MNRLRIVGIVLMYLLSGVLAVLMSTGAIPTGVALP